MSGREAHRKKKGLREQRLGIPCEAEDDGGRAKVGQVGEAKSGPVKGLSRGAQTSRFQREKDSTHDANTQTQSVSHWDGAKGLTEITPKC